jgi:hypothetical protein
MKVTVERTTATAVDIAGYRSVSVIAPASARASVQVLRHKAQAARRPRTARRRTKVCADGSVEVQLVRSSRNRLGGGARARPATQTT